MMIGTGSSLLKPYDENIITKMVLSDSDSDSNYMVSENTSEAYLF